MVVEMVDTKVAMTVVGKVVMWVRMMAECLVEHSADSRVESKVER